MHLNQTLQNHENYIVQNNYKKTCAINLYCCQLNFYKNATHYLQQFIYYFYKS